MKKNVLEISKVENNKFFITENTSGEICVVEKNEENYLIVGKKSSNFPLVIKTRINMHYILDRVYAIALDKYKPNFIKKFSTSQSHAIKHKIKQNISKVYSSRITKNIKELFQDIDPFILQCEKTLFKALGPKGFESIDIDLKKLIENYQYKNDLLQPAFWVYFKEFKSDYEGFNGKKLNLEKVEDKIKFWTKYYCLKNNKFIAKFITKYNGGLGSKIIYCKDLSKILTRDIENHTHFKLIVSCYERLNRAYNSTVANNVNIINNSSLSDFFKARDIVSKFLRYKLKFNTRSGINNFIYYIGDYPEKHNGNIVGLAEKAVRWHREEAQKHAEKIYKKYADKNLKVKIPDIGLPNIKEIEFLDTPEKIYLEGQNMGHCVGNYIEKCLYGQSFIFHAEKYNEAATLEIGLRYPCDYANTNYSVIQSQGPMNRPNKASKWAEKTMKKWLSQKNKEKNEKLQQNATESN